MYDLSSKWHNESGGKALIIIMRIQRIREQGSDKLFVEVLWGLIFGLEDRSLVKDDVLVI